MKTCQHTPMCPSCDASDAAAARIVAEHLQDCGYALLCNGLILLEGDGTLSVAKHREPKKVPAATSA